MASIDYQKKYEELIEKHQLLITDHRELIEECKNKNSLLLHWNESMTRTVGVVSIFIFAITLLLIRPDILIMVIDKFSECTK